MCILIFYVTFFVANTLTFCPRFFLPSYLAFYIWHLFWHSIRNLSGILSDMATEIGARG